MVRVTLHTEHTGSRYQYLAHGLWVPLPCNLRAAAGRLHMRFHTMVCRCFEHAGSWS